MYIDMTPKEPHMRFRVSFDHYLVVEGEIRKVEAEDKNTLPRG